MTADEERAAGWVILADHNVAIRYAVHPYVMNFAVYDCVLAGNTGDNMEWTLFWANADNVIDGALKWDGCVNWQTNPDCMMHGCGPRHAQVIADIFAAIYHVGKRHFDMLGDNPPPMPANAIERPAIHERNDHEGE